MYFNVLGSFCGLERTCCSPTAESVFLLFTVADQKSSRLDQVRTSGLLSCRNHAIFSKWFVYHWWGDKVHSSVIGMFRLYASGNVNSSVISNVCIWKLSCTEFFRLVEGVWPRSWKFTLVAPIVLFYSSMVACIQTAAKAFPSTNLKSSVSQAKSL